MMTQVPYIDPRPSALALSHLPVRKLLTSALPFIAMAVPGMAMAQQVSNTASVSAPAGATDTNLTNNSATDTDTLLAAITAVNDSATTTAGGAGVPNIISILGNDSFNGGTPSATDVDITVAAGSSVPSQLTFDTTDGTVDVVAGTPAGTYEFDYTICEAGRTDNCDTATVSVTVTAAAISADNEVITGIIGSTGQANIENAFDGDLLAGIAATGGGTGNVVATVTTPATPVNPGSPVPTLDVSTGQISVPAGTPADDYRITYQICDALNPTNCATATIDVEVLAAPIVAANDSASGIDGTAGATDVVNVLPNDTLGGVIVGINDVDISVITPATSSGGNPVPTLDTATGNISVPAGTPGGTYTITYEICEELNPTNCTRADAVITVITPTIDAVDDGPVTVPNGVAGQDDVIQVLTNDDLGGTSAALSNVTITVVTPATPINGGNVPVLNPADGTVDVPANTPAGSYTIVYEIEDQLNSGSTDTATAFIVVAPSVDLSIAKTNNVTSVRSGDSVTYILTVSNAGPDAAIGATVRDVPGAGLACPVSGSLSFGGTATAGAPTGSTTVGDLIGGGITLGTIGANENVTITYTCSVN